MNGSRLILLMAVAHGSLGTFSVARAESPEPMPSYSDAQALREFAFACFDDAIVNRNGTVGAHINDAEAGEPRPRINSQNPHGGLLPERTYDA